MKQIKYKTIEIWLWFAGNIICMFSIWALDQMDREDSVGRFTRVLWEDYNAGCALFYSDAVAWKKHFEKCHRGKLDLLLKMLEDAYVEYATSLDEQKEEL